MSEESTNAQQQTASDRGLVSIPLGAGEDEILIEVIASYLYRCRYKRKITDMNVYPKAVTLIHALEVYRQDRNIDDLVERLEIPADNLKSARETVARWQEKRAQRQSQN